MKLEYWNENKNLFELSIKFFFPAEDYIPLFDSETLKLFPVFTLFMHLASIGSKFVLRTYVFGVARMSPKDLIWPTWWHLHLQWLKSNSWSYYRVIRWISLNLISVSFPNFFVRPNLLKKNTILTRAFGI